MAAPRQKGPMAIPLPLIRHLVAHVAVWRTFVIRSTFALVDVRAAIAARRFVHLVALRGCRILLFGGLRSQPQQP